jgi:Tol biopolymer transport system component/DNA-binding winged helix-turn-helix (wHTH) protein
VSDGIVTAHNPFVFRFGEFEVKEHEFLLFRDGETQPVEPKAFRVLLFLLRNPGRLVKKDEILNAVWDDCAVSDNSLTRSIATLRKLLSDDAREPRYIATVQTVGYRFLLPVEVTEETPVRPKAWAAPSAGDLNTGVGPVRERRRSQWIPGAVLAAIVLAGGAWAIEHAVKNDRALATSSANPSPSPHFRSVQLTNLSGHVWAPAFSPDGRQFAFIWNGDHHPGKGDLYVQLVGGELPLRLTHTRSEYMNPPTWSPDGREIAFGRCDDNGGAVWVVPALGGPERKITDVPCPYGFIAPVSWTSDGRSLVLTDSCVAKGPIGIVVFSMETGVKRCLVDLLKGEELGDAGPLLSPDQQMVAFVRWLNPGTSDLYTVPLAGGTPHRLTSDNKIVGDFMWTAAGQYISFNSTRSGPERTWRVPAAGGAIEAETNYPGIGALSRDGTRLAYLGPSTFDASSLWRAEISREGGVAKDPRQLLPDSSHDYSPQPSPDGRQIVFESERSGSDQIWKCNADGSNPFQLTSLGGGSGSPRWSPDGKWIAFDSVPLNHRQVMVIDEEGRNQHVVVSGEYDNGVPAWSSDGKAIYFGSDRTGSFQVWRHDMATGQETQMTRHGGLASIESYDGKTLYFSTPNGAGIWSMSVTGGEAQRVTDAPHFGYWGSFAVTEDGLYLVDSGADPGPALMYYSFRSRQLKRILILNGPQKAFPWSVNLGASRDGRTVLLVLGTFRNSLVMAENLK